MSNSEGIRVQSALCTLKQSALANLSTYLVTIMAPAASRSSKACTECRQVKLRCDFRKNFPAPCTRCNSRGLGCRFDPAFKRTPTKGQLEKVTKQLNDLRSALVSGGPDVPNLLQIPHQMYAGDSSIGSQSDYGSSDSDEPLPRPTMHPESYFGLSAMAISDQVYRLGHFHLSSEKVIGLFHLFVKHQHKHLPIVDTRWGYDEIYSRTPFLFWTIIVVAIRGSTATMELLDQVRRPYKDYLGRVLIQCPLSLSTIQGLLLICLWPFPVEHQREDPSWNLCNIALSATSGLEIPTSLRSKSGSLTDEEEQARCRTWLACFHVSSWLGSTLAVRPPLRNVEDLSNITRALSMGSTTAEFGAHIELQRQVASYTSVLASHQGLFHSASAIQMFEKELNSVSTRCGETWTKESEFSSLIARLDLYSAVIMSASKEMTKSDSSASSSFVGASLFKGFQAAVKLISLYERLTRGTVNLTTGVSSPTPQPTYLSFPKYYHFSFAKAALFLLRFSLCEDSGFVESDRDVARNHIKIAHTLFLQHSQRPNDEPARVAHVIDTLAKIQGTKSAESIKMVVATHGDLEIVRAAARHAAQLQQRTTSFDHPPPEAPAYAPEAENNSVGVQSTHSDTSLHNLQTMPLELAPDRQHVDSWITLPYFDIPIDSWGTFHGNVYTGASTATGGMTWNQDPHLSAPTSSGFEYSSF